MKRRRGNSGALDACRTALRSERLENLGQHFRYRYKGRTRLFSLATVNELIASGEAERMGDRKSVV